MLVDQLKFKKKAGFRIAGFNRRPPVTTSTPTMIPPGDTSAWTIGTARDFQLDRIRVTVTRIGAFAYQATYDPALFKTRDAFGNTCWVAIGRLFSKVSQ